MSEFFGHFREIFRRPPGRYFVIPLMFFDALEVPGPSQSDPGMIPDMTWKVNFFMKILSHMKILSGNLLHAQCIVLAIRPCNPQQNNIKKGENSQRSQTNVQISQTQTFDKQNYPKSRPLRKIELTPSWRRITLLSIRNMLYESLKLFLRGPPQATHAPAWEIWEN